MIINALDAICCTCEEASWIDHNQQLLIFIILSVICRVTSGEVDPGLC